MPEKNLREWKNGLLARIGRFQVILEVRTVSACVLFSYDCVPFCNSRDSERLKEIGYGILLPQKACGEEARAAYG